MAAEYDYTQHANNLERIARKYYPALLKAAYDDAASDHGFDVVFDQANPRVQDVIDTLAKQVRNVSDTTREDIKRIISEGLDGGSSPYQIAQQIRASVEISGMKRAELIGITESATAYNKGAVLAYRDAGLTEVEVLDGDHDAECAAAHGQTWTLDKAESNPIAHPRCRRAFAPKV